MQFKNPELLQKLERSGFTVKEAKVYLAVLELGGAFPSRISDYAGLNRSTTYAVLLNLSVRGLVNEIEKRNKLFYQISSPDKVLRYAKDRVRVAEDGVERIKSILPDIEGLYGALRERPKITYYEGGEGMLMIYQDHTNVEKPYEMLAWANVNELHNFLPQKFFDHYVQVKEKVEITTRAIIPDTPEDREFNAIRYKNIERKIWPQMKFLKPDLFALTGEITIYAQNKVSIANFEKNTMIGTIIEDAAVHNIMKTIFELSWQSKLLKE